MDPQGLISPEILTKVIKIVSREAHPLSTALLWETVCWGWVHRQGRIPALKGVLSIELYARTTKEGEANPSGRRWGGFCRG